MRCTQLIRLTADRAYRLRGETSMDTNRLRKVAGSRSPSCQSGEILIRLRGRGVQNARRGRFCRGSERGDPRHIDEAPATRSEPFVEKSSLADWRCVAEQSVAWCRCKPGDYR